RRIPAGMIRPARESSSTPTAASRNPQAAGGTPAPDSHARQGRRIPLATADTCRPDYTMPWPFTASLRPGWSSLGSQAADSGGKPPDGCDFLRRQRAVEHGEVIDPALETNPEQEARVGDLPCERLDRKSVV